MNPILIGESKTNKFAIQSNQLGSPGSTGHLIIETLFHSNKFLGKDRLNDQSERQFELKAKLSKQPKSISDFDADITPEKGSSFLMIPQDNIIIEMGTVYGLVRFEANTNHELSVATSVITSTNAHQARQIFENGLSILFDHLSYKFSIPIHVAMVTAKDIENELQYIYYLAPPRLVKIDTMEETLFNEMAPVYALYREASNATSPYYKILCLYKIMEGLLGTLSSSLRKKAKTAGKNIQTAKAVVPQDDSISGNLKIHIGSPIKTLFDNFFSKEYRDAVAHFELRNKNALLVSSLFDTERFYQASYLADLCVRVLIARHEEALAQLHAT